MSTAVAPNLMAKVKLHGMSDSFDRLMTEVAGEQWSCTNLLDAMLQAQSDFRGERPTGGWIAIWLPGWTIPRPPHLIELFRL